MEASSTLVANDEFYTVQTTITKPLKITRPVLPAFLPFAVPKVSASVLIDRNRYQFQLITPAVIPDCFVIVILHKSAYNKAEVQGAVLRYGEAG